MIGIFPSLGPLFDRRYQSSAPIPSAAKGLDALQALANTPPQVVGFPSRETWLDCLMAWVKWQLVDDLCYWRNEEWPDARLYNEWFAKAAENQGERDARDVVLTKLYDEFIVECDTWIDRAARNFESNKIM